MLQYNSTTINKLCQSKNIRYQKILRGYERKRGFRKIDLQKFADIANNTIIKIEQGENINPTLATLKKIAKA
ncbi:MAG: hypothetical protein COY68_00655, partial [Candidatus Levybacteria bacterium CG_4_10_14_0_8_um_filter_35_23]